MLIALKRLAELLDDMPNGHPGYVMPATAYQDRLFDRRMRELNRQAILGWRARFRGMSEGIAAVYPPKVEIDLDPLGDMVSCVVEGGLILQVALGETNATAAQITRLRTYIRLLFQGGPRACPHFQAPHRAGFAKRQSPASHTRCVHSWLSSCRGGLTSCLQIRLTR